MRKVITCASYGGTGSSAVTDFLEEFKGIYCIREYEFRFLQDPYGVRDLEYALLENEHRLNSSFYIKKFIKKIKHISKSPMYKYKKFFKGNFLKITEEYLEELGIYYWNGSWHEDIVEANIFVRFFYYFVRVFQKLILRKKEESFSLKFYKTYYFSKTDFYTATKKYINKLLDLLLENNEYEYIALDQLVPPVNIKNYINYFENLKVVVVDRDPRDLYILNEEFWHEGWIPSENIEIFIRWFRDIRRKSLEKTEGVLRINFEEMVYSYEETCQKLYEFLDLKAENHINKKKIFNPDISIKNTRLWLKYPKYSDEINKIEKELSEYCYNKYE